MINEWENEYFPPELYQNNKLSSLKWRTKKKTLKFVNFQNRYNDKTKIPFIIFNFH